MLGNGSHDAAQNCSIPVDTMLERRHFDLFKQPKSSRTLLLNSGHSVILRWMFADVTFMHIDGGIWSTSQMQRQSMPANTALHMWSKIAFRGQGDSISGKRAYIQKPHIIRFMPTAKKTSGHPGVKPGPCVSIPVPSCKTNCQAHVLLKNTMLQTVGSF